METWFLWDGGQILFWVIASLMAWIVVKADELRKYNINGWLLGVSVSLMSWFGVGLYCIITVAMFLWLAWLIELWAKRFGEKNSR